MQELPWEKLSGFVLGSLILGILLRLILKNTMESLDKITDKISLIDSRLAVIDIYVQELGKMRETLTSHDRKITEIETTMRRKNGGAHHYVKPRFDLSDSE